MHKIEQAKYLKADGYTYVFCSIVAFGVLLIGASFPMLQPSFDIWQHLETINDFINNPNAKNQKPYWYATWAFVFRTLNVSDIFTYVKYIHRTQFLLSCIIIYYAARLIYSALLPTIKYGKRNHWISSMALSSTLVWLTIIGTVSTFQQAWIMWYSVNYQITLPMLFLAIALLINGFTYAQTGYKYIEKILAAMLLLVLVYLLHAGELVYMIIYMPLFIFAFLSKNNYKKALILMLVVSVLIYFGISMYGDRVPELVTLIVNNNFSEIGKKILLHGKYNIEGGNRRLANWNELYTLCVLSSLPLAIIGWHKITFVNKRVFFFIFASLIFCLIPNYEYSSGLASIVYGAPIVNRIYFASLIFLLPAIFAYALVENFKKIRNPIFLLLVVLLLIGGILIYSRYFNNAGTYFKNVHSIRNSLYKERVYINVTDAEIALIGEQIIDAEKKYGKENIMYCANYEKSHIIRYKYQRKNINFERSVVHVVRDCISSPLSKGKIIIYIN
jgi:hypothetical protein